MVTTELQFPGGWSIEQCTIGLVATTVRLSGMRGGGVVNVGVPAKEVVSGMIVGIPTGEEGWGVMKISSVAQTDMPSST